MDLKPDAVLRAIRYGHTEELLTSRAIWLCLGCHTCGARCPNEINLAPVMDVLKQQASAAGITGPERSVALFHRLFLSAIEKRGRVNEARLLAGLKLRAGGIFKDLRVGWQLLRTGRLPLRAESAEDLGDLRALAERARRNR
jgi:heterodisulfide reductase subunit C